LSEQKYAILGSGRAWHIFRGDYRNDLLYPEPQAICGVVLPDHDTTMAVKRPVRWAMCNRCLKVEEKP
jgi:hypothetical protein